MKFNFDALIDRRNTNSMKWNVKEDEIAMWVADMDFQTAPCVQQAIQKKATLGIYGYSELPEAYFTSYQQWWKQRHQFEIDKDWMMFSSGVIPAISSIVRRMTSPAEKILVQSPVYNIFYNSILNNGREVISSDIVYENGTYHISFTDLERKLQDPQTTMMILCNPHNPIGKIWGREELTRIGALCYEHHVLVVSDEIHCDLTEPGYNYTPFASVNEQCKQNSITCISASKAFNLAGLQSACVVVPNSVIRHKVWRGLNNDEVADPNVFSCEATIAAFHDGASWLDELRTYISENKKAAKQFIKENLPHIQLVASEATYLLWIDCHTIHPFVDMFCKYLREKKKLLISDGAGFGKNGEDFIRINVACPQERMMDGLKRLKEGIEEFTEEYIRLC